MAILPILTEPDANLRRPSSPIEAVDDSVRKLMHDLLETMHHAQGIGLAAAQVNCHKRIFVIDLQGCDDEERPAGFFPLFISNPQIIEHSSEIAIAEEGCLSIPEQIIEVPRPRAIKFRFLDYDNQEREISSSGLLGRAFQHEDDHGHGKLITRFLPVIERLKVNNRLKALKRIHQRRVL